MSRHPLLGDNLYCSNRKRPGEAGQTRMKPKKLGFQEGFKGSGQNGACLAQLENRATLGPMSKTETVQVSNYPGLPASMLPSVAHSSAHLPCRPSL